MPFATWSPISTAIGSAMRNRLMKPSFASAICQRAMGRVFQVGSVPNAQSASSTSNVRATSPSQCSNVQSTVFGPTDNRMS